MAIPIYRKIWEEFHGKKIPKGYHIHHIDGNHNNNDPENLIACTPEEHAQYHTEMGQPWCANLIVKHSADSSGENNPMYGKNFLDHMDPEAKEEYLKDHKIRMKEQNNRPEVRESRRKQMTGKGNNMYGVNALDRMTPEAREQKALNHKEYMNRPEVRAKNSAETSAQMKVHTHECICGWTGNAGNYAQHHGNNCKKEIL